MLGLNPEFFTIKQLKNVGMWPLEYLSVHGMLPYLRRMHKDALVGIEIGVLKGDNIYTLLTECPKISKIYGIDHFKAHTDYDTIRTQDDMDQFKSVAKENLEEFGDRVELIEQSSKEAASKFEKESVDFVLIDGDHSKEGIISDLTLYYPLIRKGGYVFIHDINMPSVAAGVREFKDANKIRLPSQRSKNFVSFWIKP